jgi:3'(2'), 5'-bisphosphate nucleotidase
VDLCLAADGAAAGWHGDSSVHHVAGGLAVLLAAGGVALTPDGEPLVLGPEAQKRLRFVAASDLASARELLRAVG